MKFRELLHHLPIDKLLKLCRPQRPAALTAFVVRPLGAPKILRSHAQADLELYEFFKGQGAVVVNDAADFAGTNGCYLYQGRDVQERKNKDLRGQILVLAPSEGNINRAIFAVAGSGIIIFVRMPWRVVGSSLKPCGAERSCWQISRSREGAKPGIPGWPEKSNVGAAGMPL